MRRVAVLSLTVLLALVSSAQAQYAISLGSYTLLPNTANQQIPIFVTTTAPAGIVGADIAIKIGGAPGGADVVSPPNAVDGPTISYIDLDGGKDLSAAAFLPLASTIFSADSNATSQTPAIHAGGPNEHLAAYGLTTQSFSPVANPNGQIGTLVISTLGLTTPGTWPIYMYAVGNGQVTDIITTTFDQAFPQGTDGTLTIVPEPSSIILGLLAAAGLGFVAIRRRRRA